MRLAAATGDAVARLDGGSEGLHVTLALEGSGVRCLAAAGGRLLAGGRGAWLSDDGGASWNDLRLPHDDVFSVAIGPTGTLFAGCEPSMLFRSDDGGRTWRELEALRTIPSAPTWSFPPRPWTSHVRWIAPSPHDADLLLVGIELGGLMWSGDGGETWEDHRPGAKLDVHCLAWHPTEEGRAYEAAGDGTAWSGDGGRSWDPVDAGRDRNYAWALAVDPGDPDTWYVSASTGPFQAHRAGRADAFVYRWAGAWEGVAGPYASMPYALLVADGPLWAGFADGTIEVDTHRVPLTGDSLGSILALVGL